METILWIIYGLGFIVTYILVIWYSYYDINDLGDHFAFGLVALLLGTTWPVAFMMLVPTFVLNKIMNKIRK